MCQGQKSLKNGHSTFNKESLWLVSQPCYWVDDHPLVDGNCGSLDPGTHGTLNIQLAAALKEM